MDIEDAFTAEAIEAAGVDIGGPEESDVRDMIRRVLTSASLEFTDAEGPSFENVAVLCFVAGRAYQADLPIAVPMSNETLGAFLEYLTQRGTE